HSSTCSRLWARCGSFSAPNAAIVFVQVGPISDGPRIRRFVGRGSASGSDMAHVPSGLHPPRFDVFHHLGDHRAPAVMEAHFLVFFPSGLVAVDGDGLVSCALSVFGEVQAGGEKWTG